MNVDISGDSRASSPPRPGLWSLLWHSGLGWSLLAGLPAVLAGAGVLALASAVAISDPNGHRADRLEEAVRLLKAKKYPAALLGFERVRELDGGGEGDREVRYNLAVCLEAVGEHDRAATLIDRLAPDDRAGFAPAHIWKARRLIVGADRPPAALTSAESHLLRAVQDAPDLIEANVLLGQFYLATARPERAVPYLEKIAFDRPELLMPLARALAAGGNRIQARSRATAARQIFQSRAEADLDDYPSRLRWIEAAVFLHDFAGAVAALSREDGPGRDPRDSRALAQVYTGWADALGRKPGSNLAERLAILEKGLALDPGNVDLLERFSRLIRAGGSEGDRARAALRELAAGGRATGPVYFALGLDAWEHGRPAEARLHWQEAFRLDPSSLVIANNLACALAAGPEPDLKLALAAINPVVTVRPDEPRFRETRGQILAKLERWKEALIDLNAALLVYPESPDLHRALAQTYAHLDAPAMAAEHRKRADATPGDHPSQIHRQDPAAQPPAG